MIYKTLKKVSEYCQLIKNGTFQDGFNGWSSQEISYNIIDGICYCTINSIGTPSIYTFQPTIIKYHKYLMSFDIFPNYSNSANANGFYLKGNVVQYNIIQKQWNKVEKIVTVTWDTIGALALYVNNKPNKEIGDIANFKNIQLFDLTEMYGAGNEPTTVEEFRQDFPEEMYDYKPYCFVKSYKTLLKATDNKIITSYKKSLACKTKNLFDINQSINDTHAENAFDTFSINDNVITATSDNSTTKIVVMRLFYGELPAGDYILSLNAVIENTSKHTRHNEIFIFKNGSFLTLNNSMPTDGSYSPKIKFTLSEKAEIKISFYKNVNASQETVSNTVYKVTLSNIQLELGDTATEYHPYGYL